VKTGPPPRGDAAAGAFAIAARLRAGRPTAVRATGTSMQPFVVEGDRLLVEPCPARALRPGDLLAFERAGGLVLHRVLGVDPGGDSVVEKGDNLRAPTRIRGSAVLGRARLAGAALGPWLARLSAAHGRLHALLDRPAILYPSARLALALEAADAALRATLRAARTRSVGVRSPSPAGRGGRAATG